MKKSDRQERNYGKYRDRGVVLAGVAAVAAAVFFSAGYVFCEDVRVSALFAAIGVPVTLYEFIVWRRARIITKLEEQFAEVMQSVLTGLSAGQTAEQAFAELAESSMGKRPDLRLILREIRIINRRVQMHYSFYEAFDRFAKRSESEDIRNFSDVLKIAGARGGNLVYIVRNALADLRIKLETDREIRHTLALPRYNHRILTVMPFFLVFLLKTISYEYVRVLYTTRPGQIISACAAAAILISWILGDRLCSVKY